MARLQLRNCSIRICDGTRPTLTNQGVTYTSVVRGSEPPSITLVVAGVSTALSATVSNNRHIVVNLATDGSSVGTTTAAQLIAYLLTIPAVTAVVTPSGAGASALTAVAKTSLTTGPTNYIELKMGSGTLDFSETRNYDTLLNRGVFDTLVLGDDAAMTVNASGAWEELRASTGATVPTWYEAWKKLGAASAWLTSDTNCDLHCLDLELIHTPACSNVEPEVYIFPAIPHPNLGGNTGDRSFSLQCTCNAVQPIVYRKAVA